MANFRVLVVDHVSQRREHLRELLRARQIESIEAASCEEALSHLARNPVQLILTETELPTKSGLYLLKKVKERHPNLEVVLITHNASSYNLLQALRHGAYDFIVRPIDSGEILYNSLDRAFAQVELRSQNNRLLKELELNNRSLLRALKMTKALSDAIESLVEAESIENLLTALLTSSLEAIQARRGFIAIFDRTSGSLGIKISKGIQAPSVQSLSTALPPGLTAAIAKRGKPVLLGGNLPKELLARSHDSERKHLFPDAGLLAVPLTIKQRTAGLVVLNGHADGSPFGQHEMSFLMQLTHHAALALQKAGTIYRLQQAAQRRQQNSLVSASMS